MSSDPSQPEHQKPHDPRHSTGPQYRYSLHNEALSDILGLYRWAVQAPETHAEVLRIMYQSIHPDSFPLVLREDFCGTSAESGAWVALQAGRSAIAVDIDGKTIEWAKRRADRILGGRARQIEFIHSDVMEVELSQAKPADILSVLNFSIFHYHDRETLNDYLTHAAGCLAPGGLLVFNAFGGSGSLTPRVDSHQVIPMPILPSEAPVPPFEYVWEQRPIDRERSILECNIHFNVQDAQTPGGIREVRNAFHYEFRIWPIQELMDEVHLAGFDKVEVWRHTYEPEQGGDGLFLGPVPISEIMSLDRWTAYVVATKSA